MLNCDKITNELKLLITTRNIPEYDVYLLGNLSFNRLFTFYMEQ